jgi:hypothetical protein
MPLQGKKLPEAATYGIIQNRKGQTRSIESDPFGSPYAACSGTHATYLTQLNSFDSGEALFVICAIIHSLTIYT